MMSHTGPLPTGHPKGPPTPAFGWASVFIGCLSLCLFLTLRPATLDHQGAMVGATLSGMAGATGVGLGMGAIRVGARPLWAAWLGLVGNLVIVLAVAGQIIAWW